MSTIKLLSASKNVRCFPPYTESPRTLSIQLTDGRTLYLRAKKDLDLERWFFVLSKIWSLQQLIHSPHNCQEMVDVAPSGCTRAVSAVGALSERDDAKARAHSLPARQQSMQLIHRYLSQRRQQRRVPQHDEPQHLKPSPPEPSSQPLEQDSPSLRYRLIPLPTLNETTKARDTQEKYQFPTPARLSKFLPTEFDWDMEDSEKPRRQIMEESGDDREKLTSTTQDGPKLRAKSPPVQTHPTSPFNNTTRDYLDVRAAEMPVPHQPRQEERPVFWPAMTMLAPEKAAAIDAWRRSLLSPLMMGDEASYHPNDAENKVLRRKDHSSQDDDNACGNTFESPIPGRTKDKPDTFPSWARQKDECIQSPLMGTGSERVSYEAAHLPMPGQSGANRPKTTLFPSGREEVESYHPIQRRASYDMTAYQLSISQESFPGKDSSEELPLGLIKLNRHSRWQKTQLSSEDGTSAANRNSFPTLDALDALLPPAPITPKQMPREIPPLEDTPMVKKPSNEGSSEWVTTLADPTLSFHGSSYSHFPIHDPEFVYPRHGQHPMSTLSNNRRPSCPTLSFYPSHNSLDHTHHGSTHPLVSFTCSPPNATHTPVDNNNNNNNMFSSSRSVPSMMMRRESSPLPGGQSMQESLARYYEQKQQQRQSWLQWQQEDEVEEEDEEVEEDDDDEENEPLVQTRERRQQSIQYQQSTLQTAQKALDNLVAPQVVEVPVMMTSVQEAKKNGQAQESVPLLVVPPPPQVQAVQVQELEEPSDEEEENQDDDVENPATSDDEDMDEFCYF
ncbi:hypothetical protein BG006_001609 [Podila minutissima]|uniref:PH domain-containing protein n=1 Tax=Podila minutissima TaxID=64525 RepID=A0A9P5SNQ5_9FUNG|nr:hypothetical protein BG006_001609 [Podila minutissima]